MPSKVREYRIHANLIWWNETNMINILNDHTNIKDIIDKQWLPECTLSSVSPKSLLAASLKSSLLHTFTGSWGEIFIWYFISINCKSQTQINIKWHSILNNSKIENLKSTSSRLGFNSITKSCLPFLYTPSDWNQNWQWKGRTPQLTAGGRKR